MVQPGHVSLWHPWVDKPGANHRLSLWNEEKSYAGSNVMDISKFIAGNQLYAFVNDVLDESEIPDSTALIRSTGHQNTFISRTGNARALARRWPR